MTALEAARRAAARHRRATAARDAAVVAAVAAGASQRQVAEACGLSHVGVAKIVRRLGVEAPAG